MPIFQRLQKRRDHARVLQEALNRLKAYHPFTVVEQHRNPQSNHHQRVAMQDRKRLTPVAMRVVWRLQYVV